MPIQLGEIRLVLRIMIINSNSELQMKTYEQNDAIPPNSLTVN